MKTIFQVNAVPKILAFPPRTLSFSSTGKVGLGFRKYRPAVTHTVVAILPFDKADNNIK